MAVASTHVVCDPTRTASYFSTSANWTHCTVASIERLYRSGALPVLEKCLVQSENGVAKGKKQHDKRSDIKERECRWIKRVS